MTIQGFLDFQEGTIWQSDIAFTEASLNQATGTTVTFPASGTYVCSNWQATQFRCTTTTRIFDFTAQWFTDAAGFNQIGERRWSIYDGWPLPTYLTLGNLGPYMRVQVSNFAGGNGNAFVRGLFTNRPLGPFQPGYATPMIQRAYGALAGGANVTHLANYLYAGPATWGINTDSNEAWAAVLVGQTSSGVAYDIAAVGQPGAVNARFTTAVVLPPLFLSAVLFNQGAGAHNWSIGVTPDVFR